MADYKSGYSGAEVEALLDKVDALPTPTSSDIGKVLRVAEAGGTWELFKPATIYVGTAAPTSVGQNGDIYLQQ